MTDARPLNWDWVKATHECSAVRMFGRLQELAQRDVDRRNEQLEKKPFLLLEENGISFSVGYANRGMDQPHVGFQVTEDLKQIVVRRNGQEKTIYSIGLNDDGVCTLRSNGAEVPLWQCLKAALEPLLFG